LVDPSEDVERTVARFVRAEIDVQALNRPGIHVTWSGGRVEVEKPEKLAVRVAAGDVLLGAETLTGKPDMQREWAQIVLGAYVRRRDGRGRAARRCGRVTTRLQQVVAVAEGRSLPLRNRHADAWRDRDAPSQAGDERNIDSSRTRSPTAISIGTTSLVCACRRNWTGG
jgi:hypothetical protein